MKHFILSTTFFFACLVTAAQANLNRGLVAWYPFNGNANDVSGNGHNGIVQNGATLTSDKNGTPNSAYFFDGIDDYILIPDNPSLRFRDSFSVCISYMKLSQPGGNLIEKRSFNSGTNSSFDIAAGSNGANGAVKTWGDCSDAGSGWNYTSFTQPPVLNQWYCLVMTFNAGTLNLYEDGVLISSTTTSNPWVDSCAGSDIRIGYHLSFDPIALHGKVDDVRLYNRALTQEEASSLCSTTSVTTCNNNWLKMPNALSGVTIGDLDITGNQVTIEAICNATGDTTRALVSKHTSPSNVNYFLCPDLAQITTTNGFFSITSSCPFDNNKTYHVALVYNGSSLKLYRNGFLLGEVPASGNLVTNNLPTTIGEQAYAMDNGLDNISNIFKGVINEVRIWNVARSQSDIRTYMNSSLPSPTTQTGLQAYYVFDDLTNKQGNAAFNGTLRGAATIGNANPDCVFSADSCLAAPVSCNTWLNMPAKLTGVSIGELDITGNQVTVEAMCTATDIYDLSRALVSKHGWSANCNYFLCPDLAQITTSDGFFSATSPCSFVSNKTYHVAMVYNGSSLRLYRNGFLMQEVPASGNLVTNNWPATIGEYAYAVANNNASISNIFKGYINEVRIWNIARTQQQIRDFMNIELPSPSTQNGLLAYYNFNNLINKQGNSAYNATLLGASTINATNSTCSFTADSCIVPVAACDDWLSTPVVNSSVSAGDLDIAGNTITVEALINRTEPYLPGGGNNTEGDIVSKHNTFSDVNYLLRPNHAYITTTNGFFGTPDVCDLLLNKTYHVAMVYDGSILKFYRDGMLMSQINATGNLILNNWQTRIGWYEPQGFTTQFLGYINEVRIWNTARTQSQLKTYMFTKLPDPTTQTGLRAYYSFDNLLNKQGNTAYNGIINGSAVINQINPNCSFLVDSCSSVLPVTLVSFTSRASNEKTIILNWTTGQEYGISKYLVQRSLYPDRGFETIGSVNAAATGNANSYSFVDRTVKLNTRYFYRLLILETSGTSRYSPTRDQLITAGGTYTSVYPNPTTGTVLVSVKNYDGVAYLHLINSLGQSILSKTTLVNGGSSGIVLQMGSLPRGTYYLQIMTGNERITKKIIKQ